MCIRDRLNPDGDAESSLESYWRRTLIRVAREVEIVEAVAESSPPLMREWDALRAEQPELGLFTSNSISRWGIMPWRELVAPDRTWPSDIDALVEQQLQAAA